MTLAGSLGRRVGGVLGELTMRLRARGHAIADMKKSLSWARKGSWVMRTNIWWA